ncbi:hypothetical protein UFOVP230_32 [uncultured Caudovirales phage]|uniref:Uncharacterized protein n=1 Tax=uncultured Caudovirales phage TaxID=2100421 RepID=A0A6J7XNV7_9CAUD|nr:hypothetical protein UFOVP230_32 [uncultured Caudovirales phage]
MKETTEEYIAKLKAGLATLETALYKAKMSAQEVNTRKNKQIAEQQAEINQQQEEKKALYNLIAEQDKKIIDLAFKLAYAERGNEIVLEANTRSRP